MLHIPKNKGFTLIELLVVISIIALLSSIVLASLNTAREKAKDAATLQNIKQLRLAMELYYNDKGYYPGQDGGFTTCSDPEYCSFSSDNFNDVKSSLSPYISNIGFIGNSFLIAGLDAYYFHNIIFVDDSGEYSCDGSEVYTKYLFAFPIYDTSGRPTNLPLPIDNNVLVGTEHYCVGV